MGTKIQTNVFLPEYHSIIDLDGNTKNGTMSLYRDSQIIINGQDHPSFASQMCKTAYLGHDTDKVRQTILKHESIFRNQLQELHRIYRRQQDLMNEVKRREVKHHQALYEKDAESSRIAVWTPQNTPEVLKSNLYLANRTNGVPDSRFTLDQGNTSTNFSNSHLVLQDFFRNSLDADKRRISENSATGGSGSAKSPLFSQSLPAESRNELSSSPLDMGKSLSRKKRKIFGVEISEGDDDEDSYDAASNTSVIAFSKKESVSKPQLETPSGGLPWFLRKTPYDDEPSKRMKSSYVMNLDSLQNFSQNFFRKGEISNGPSQNSDQKNEISVAKSLGFPISNMLQEVKTDEIDPRDRIETEDLVLQKVSDLRHVHIDLNLPLDEEDASSAPLIPTAVVKIAITEIDLEAPAIIESEPEGNSELYSESDKHLADTLIYISSSGEKNPVDAGAREPPEALSIDNLKLFGEIISSQCAPDEEDSVPDGMDYFEFMTLKLEDIKEDRPVYDPMVSNSPSDDETGGWGTTPSKRSRRGLSRRRKDFQKDVLPGLVTLSRHEVAEDLQAFDEICKAEGSGSRFSQRKGRGRKRLGGFTTSRPGKPTEQVVSRETGIEVGSLTGWGKRTRRLPRQRCTNAYISFAVKC